MFASASEYILLSLNFFEIIINLIYLALYFANISFGVVLNSSTTSNNSSTPNCGSYQQNDDDYLKYYNRSSAWLTIMDDKLDSKPANTNNSDSAKNNNTDTGKKITKFAVDQVDSASTLTHRGNQAKTTNEDHNVKKPFYKTLPKTFTRRDDKNKANGMARNGSLRGSQESLKSGQTGASSSSSSSSASLHNMAPNRPPPPPPTIRRNSGVHINGAISPATTTSYLTTTSGAPSREQMFISLLSSVFGFFSAKFHLTWLLLFYSIYIVTGVALWLYNHAFVYRRVRHLNQSEQANYIRRSSAPKAASLIVSAPSQSLGLSSAFDLTKVCDNMYDEVHMQMLASRRDVVDMGLKLLLTACAYNLSKSL